MSIDEKTSSNVYPMCAWHRASRYNHVLIIQSRQNSVVSFCAPPWYRLPQQNSPSPSLQHLNVLIVNVGVASLDSCAEFLDTLLHRLGDSQRDLVREDVQHSTDEEGDASESPLAENAVLDVRDEALGFSESVLGVVRGRLGIHVGASPEDLPDEGDKGRPTSMLAMRGA